MGAGTSCAARSSRICNTYEVKWCAWLDTDAARHSPRARATTCATMAALQTPRQHMRQKKGHKQHRQCEKVYFVLLYPAASRGQPSASRIEGEDDAAAPATPQCRETRESRLAEKLTWAPPHCIQLIARHTGRRPLQSAAERHRKTIMAYEAAAHLAREPSFSRCAHMTPASSSLASPQSARTDARGCSSAFAPVDPVAAAAGPRRVAGGPSPHLGQYASLAAW
jgi:hypothetical protein